MPVLHIPNLDGLGLPAALVTAVRQAFMYIQGLYTVQPQAFLQSIIPVTGTLNQKIYIQDFDHYLQWDGRQWQWAPGDMGSGMFLVFPSTIAPYRADGATLRTGWVLCGGQAVNYLKPNGSIASVTLPSTPNQYFRQ